MKKLSNENLEKIRQIVLKTRRVMLGVMNGSSRSARKGMGLDFESLRDYSVGDDIRFIDWKASARSQSLLVKEFYQEQSINVMVVIDVSSSMNFGVNFQQKFDHALQLASAIILMAEYSRDAVGLVMYSNKIHVAIPPAKGLLHTQYLLECIMSFNPLKKAETQSKVALDFLLGLKIFKGFLFIISDGLEPDFITTIRSLVNRYNLYLIRCFDEREHRLPHGAWLMIEDNETCNIGYLQLNRQINPFLAKYHQDFSDKLSKNGATILNACSVDDGINALVRVFNSMVV